MKATTCSGPTLSSDFADPTLYCPATGSGVEEADCDRCQAERERWDELRADCVRDEA